MPLPNEQALRDRLKLSITNSRRKKYHGDDDNMNVLPTLSEQALAFIEEKTTPWKLMDQSGKKFLEESDPKWA